MCEAYKQLSKYKQYNESQSCYLDGRYFNMVFQDYPGLIPNPLYIHITDDKQISIHMANSICFKEHMSLIRVIITTSHIRHAMLVILDHDNGLAWIYDPDLQQKPDELHKIVIDAIINYLQQFVNYEFILVDTNTKKSNYKAGCPQSGNCHALIIKYAQNLLDDKKFTQQDVSSIRKYMSAIEENYTLPLGIPDVQYDWSSNQVIVTTTGAAIGAVAGGLSAGLPGALVIGGTGALLGYGLGSI